MKHRWSNLLTVLSLLLFIAAASEWVRSCYHVEDFESARYHNKTSGWSAYDRRSILPLNGELVYVHSLMLRDPRFNDGFSTGLLHRQGNKVNTSYYSHVVYPDGGAAGFSWRSIHEKNAVTNYMATGFRFPLWALALLTAVLPVHFLIKVTQKAKRRSAGHCAHCGYDLLASPNRCPECGASTGMKS
jgi:hypothetical protein